MIVKLVFPVIMVWTLVAVILHFAGVGAFAEWAVTAVPWHWSCLCILWWDLIVALLCILLQVFIKWILWVMD